MRLLQQHLSGNEDSGTLNPFMGVLTLVVCCLLKTALQHYIILTAQLR